MEIHNIKIEHYYEIADILLSLEAQLRYLELWEFEVPSADQLQSQEPFSVDTLTFTQWIQFVLIPRMKLLVEEQAPLPSQSDISAYAVEAFNGVSFPIDELLRLIQHLDNILNA